MENFNKKFDIRSKENKIGHNHLGDSVNEKIYEFPFQHKHKQQIQYNSAIIIKFALEFRKKRKKVKKVP